MPGAVPHTSTYALTNVTLPVRARDRRPGLARRPAGRSGAGPGPQHLRRRDHLPVGGRGPRPAGGVAGGGAGVGPARRRACDDCRSTGMGGRSGLGALSCGPVRGAVDSPVAGDRVGAVRRGASRGAWAGPEGGPAPDDRSTAVERPRRWPGRRWSVVTDAGARCASALADRVPGPPGAGPGCRPPDSGDGRPASGRTGSGRAWPTRKPCAPRPETGWPRPTCAAAALRGPAARPSRTGRQAAGGGGFPASSFGHVRPLSPSNARAHAGGLGRLK